MNRQELDDFAAHHRLSVQGVERMLAHARAYPERDEINGLARLVLQIGGVLSLCAGVIFFIAANWSALGIFGHFALLQGALLITIVAALVRPPPHRVGRLSVFAAFIAVGALLALFGQTYQTGADLYELFLLWSVLALPLVIAGQWAGTWAAWLIVLNVAFGLFCGWVPGRGALWIIFADWGFNDSLLLLIPAALNLLIWYVAESSQATYVRVSFPSWVRRIAIVAGVGFATWSGIFAILRDDHYYGAPAAQQVSLTWILLISAIAVPAWLSFRWRRDVLPITAIAGSIILLVAVGLAKIIAHADVGVLFLESIWLVASSTLVGRGLTHLQREWRPVSTKEPSHA